MPAEAVEQQLQLNTAYGPELATVTK